MALYTALELSFVNDRLVEPGQIVEFTGEAGKNLQLVAPAPIAKADKDAGESLV